MEYGEVENRLVGKIETGVARREWLEIALNDSGAVSWYRESCAGAKMASGPSQGLYKGQGSGIVM